MVQGGQKVKKKLPKRTGKDSKQRRIANSIRRSQDRKDQHRREQERRHRDNIKLQEQGQLTPWQETKLLAQQRHGAKPPHTAPRSDGGNVVTGTDPMGIVTVRGWGHAKCLAVLRRGYVHSNDRNRLRWMSRGLTT